MSKRMKTTIELLAYDGAAQTNDPTDIDRIKLILEETSITEFFRRKEAIANATTDYAIIMPDAATDYLLLFTDQEISIKLNGSVTALTLKPKIAGTKTFGFYQRGTISAITLTNASGSVANIDLIAVNI